MVAQISGITVNRAREVVGNYIKREEALFNERAPCCFSENSLFGELLNRVTYCPKCEVAVRERERVHKIFNSLSGLSETREKLLPVEQTLAVLPYLSQKEIGELNFEQIRGIGARLSGAEFCAFLEKLPKDSESRLIWQILARTDQYNPSALATIINQAWFNNYLTKKPAILETFIQNIAEETFSDKRIKGLLVDLIGDSVNNNYVDETLPGKNSQCFIALLRIRSGSSFAAAVQDIQTINESSERGVLVVVGNKRILSERNVLISKSLFFKKILKDQREIRLKGVNQELFRRVNRFMLTGYIEIDENNVHELLEMGNFLGIRELLDKAERFLISKRGSFVAEQLLRYAEKYALPNLKESCERGFLSVSGYQTFAVLSESFRRELELARIYKLNNYLEKALFKRAAHSFSLWLEETDKDFNEIVDYAAVAEYFDEERFLFFKRAFEDGPLKIITKEHFIPSVWLEAQKKKRGSGLLKTLCAAYVKERPLAALRLFNNLVPDELQDPLNEALFL